MLFGTTDGQIVIMSSTGAMLGQVTIHDGMEISSLTWSCEKFNMDEIDASTNQQANNSVELKNNNQQSNGCGKCIGWLWVLDDPGIFVVNQFGSMFNVPL